MTILLIRHGQTELNAAQVLQPPDTPLGARGHAQAAALARRAATLAPMALLSSDMPRAWQTAQAVAAATGLAIEAEPLLQERSFGDWRGRSWLELGIDPNALPETPPGGESLADFERRVALAWARVVARRAALAGPLLVVSHGLVIRRMLAAHARLAAGQALMLRLENTSLSQVGAEPPHPIELAGCVAHLD